MFTQPTRYLGDRTVWMNPVDAQRLGIKNGDMAEIEGIDTNYVGQARITVTNKVVPGAVLPSVSPEATELSTL